MTIDIKDGTNFCYDTSRRVPESSESLTVWEFETKRLQNGIVGQISFPTQPVLEQARKHAKPALRKRERDGEMWERFQIMPMQSMDMGLGSRKSLVWSKSDHFESNWWLYE